MPDNKVETATQGQTRASLIRIFAAAVAAVEPGRVIANVFEGQSSAGRDVSAMLEKARGVSSLAVGKAAAGMAREARKWLGTKLCNGLVIAPGPAIEDLDFRFMPGAHPVPDASSQAAGRAALQFVSAASSDDLILVLLSGGASALMALPANGLTLQEKVSTTSALMNAGAPIRELNTVRKHLSGIKGGRMLQSAAAAVLTLIISDVPGNDLTTIGSGPTVEDPTTYSDSIAILKRNKLWGRAPEAVRTHLERGAAGEIAETPKKGDPALQRVRNVVVADNGTAVDAACVAAAALGYNVERWRELRGDANTAGTALAAYLCGIERERSCVIAGGETVVSVKAGGGRGGRSQQAALAAAIELARHRPRPRIVMLFAGTDGIDGPTDAAGAIATPATVSRAAEAKLDPELMLRRNDSYSFFKALGDSVITGPTGTNVADLFIGLVNY